MIIKTLTNISGEIWAQDENRLLIKNMKIPNKQCSTFARNKIN